MTSTGSCFQILGEFTLGELSLGALTFLGAHLSVCSESCLWGEGAYGCSPVSDCKSPQLLLGSAFGAVVKTHIGVSTLHSGVSDFES